MTKKKAIIKFCVICTLVALGITLTFVSFRIPFTNGRTWEGSIGAIETRLGIDLRGGVLIVYDARPNPEAPGNFDAQMNATIRRLEDSLRSNGLVEARVMRQGGSQIRVEVPGFDDIEELLDIIGRPALIEFRTSNDVNEVPFITGRHISSVDTGVHPSYSVLLSFTSEGRSELQTGIGRIFDDTNNHNNQLFIFSNGVVISAPEVEDRNIGIGNRPISITSADFTTRARADELRLQIESGLFAVLLDENPNQSGVIPATLGQGALTAGIIAFAVGLAFIFIFMLLLYGHMGLLSNLSMLVFSVLFLWSLGWVNMVQLTLPGIAGIILAMAMAVDANIIIFERIKDEFKAGKKLSIAVEGGFKKSFWTIFDANITTIIAATVLYFLGTGPIQGFAITLLLGVGISMFCSLFVLRQFAKLYLYINPNNAKHLRLKQQYALMDQPKTTVKKERKLKGV